ncbi:MAG: CoA transferase [Chloroflexi bacterium]|nr:CoA transferase [Chloroflexota bacterium]
MSVQETVIATFYHRLAMYAYTGISESRGLDDTMPCADGYVQPQRGPSVTWDSYVAFFGAPEALLHPKFQTREGQQLYVDEVRAALIPALMERPRYDWFHDGQAMGMPFGLVQTLEEVANCQQLRGREFFQTVEHPAAGPLPHPSPPYRWDANPLPLRPAPLLGQHNAAVFGDLLGHSQQDMLQLTAMGII